MTKSTKRPHGAQQYLGNENHEWEPVVEGTERLRVPGGWLYSVSWEDGGGTMTFVPVPNILGYAI
jgi:hypothetical protein